MSDMTINSNVFGSERTRRWAERINQSKTDQADKGIRQAGKQYRGAENAEKVQHSRHIKETAPPQSGRTQMNKEVGTLGSGRWSTVG